MKKFYFVLITFASVLTSKAQFITLPNTINESAICQIGDNKISKPPSGAAKAAGEILFSETFTGGMANWTTSGDNGNVWQYDTNGPSGPKSPASAIITSPTSQTGFVNFDADLENSTAGGFAKLNGNLESPTIDLSSAPGAVLSFYTSYASNSPAFTPIIEVSTDGFATKKEYILVVTQQVESRAMGTIKLSVNLSSFLQTATNKNLFKFRFVWKESHYFFWQIDDITITEPAENDLELDKLFLANITTNYEQTEIPKSFGENLVIQGIIKNMGFGAIPASTQLKVTITDKNGVQIATETGGILKINNLQLDADTITFATTINIGTFKIDTYTVNGELVTSETDNNLTNNKLKRTLKVTEYLLGQRNFELGTFPYSIGTQFGQGANAVEMTFGNVVEIPSSQEKAILQGLVITITNSERFSTTENSEIEIKLYEFDPNNNNFKDLEQSRFFTITKAMIPLINTSLDVLFNLNLAEGSTGPFELEGGKYYYIGVYCSGEDDHFAYQFNCGDEDRSSWVRGPFDGTNVIWSEHYLSKYAGRQIHTSMNFDPKLKLANLTKLQANGVKIHNLYPNPGSNQTTLYYNLNQSSEIGFKVTDITGKIIYSMNPEIKNEGNHEFQIDASSMNSGIYYITLTTTEGSLTQKWIKK